MEVLNIVEGKRPIILSAPHVFAHSRLNLERKLKQGEPWTDEIVREISRQTECFGIYTIGDTLDFDPNFTKELDNPYKAQIRKLVKKQKIKYLIDIHGLSDSHQYDFGIYFKSKFIKSRNLAFKVAEEVNKGILRNSLINVLYFKPDGQETVAEFCCEKLKIPAIQIEIARYIRESDVLRSELISRLSDLVKAIDK